MPDSQEEKIGLIMNRIKTRDDFSKELFQAKKLEVEKYSNQSAFTELIKMYANILKKLPSFQNDEFVVLLHIQLAKTYYDNPMGDRKKNLENALFHYNKVLVYYKEEKNSFNIALTLFNIGNIYSDLSDYSTSITIDTAIIKYNEALDYLAPEENIELYIEVRLRLWNAYYFKKEGDILEDLRISIDNYSKALEVIDPLINPDRFALIKQNIGFAYLKLYKNNIINKDSLRIAKESFLEAKKIINPKLNSSLYAEICKNIGDIYTDYNTGAQHDNIKIAIKNYDEALKYRNPDIDPIAYGAILNNKGCAYNNLLCGDIQKNLENAIYCFNEALKYRKPDTFPKEYSDTMNNLGNAYSEFIIGDIQKNLAIAIECFKKSKIFYNPVSFPLEYARILNNIGVAYSKLLTGNRQDNLKSAISYFIESLQYLRVETTSFEYASSYSNLASCYSNLETGDTQENQLKAIESYQKALLGWKSELFPLQYARVNCNLGKIYLGFKENDDENLKLAIFYFNEGLKYLNIYNNPRDFKKTLFNLGEVHSRLKQWDIAYHYYNEAINIVELLISTGLSFESISNQIKEDFQIFQSAAFSSAMSKKNERALTILEKGRAILLKTILRQNEKKPDQVPDHIWTNFIKIRQKYISIIYFNSDFFQTDTVKKYEEINSATNGIIRKYRVALNEIKKYFSDIYSDIHYSEIKKSIPDTKTAVINFCFTDLGTIVFIIRKDREEIVQIHLNDFSNLDLFDLLMKFSKNSFPIEYGWLFFYNLYVQNKVDLDQLHIKLNDVLIKIGKKIINPILKELQGINNLIIIPSGNIFLIPLHSVPISDKERLCDYYNVSYLPSFYLLNKNKLVIPSHERMDILSIENPTFDLPFTRYETNCISSLFPRKKVLVGKNATRNIIITNMPSSTYIHFSCHGYYNWKDVYSSGLELNDGNLSFKEILDAELDLCHIKLVTLSACETGIPDIIFRSPNEYIGLPYAFILSGVQCVISSLWAVSDFSTFILMQRLYHYHISGKNDVNIALNMAQNYVRNLRSRQIVSFVDYCLSINVLNDKQRLKEMREKYCNLSPEIKPFSEPYYWAGFYIVGVF